MLINGDSMRVFITGARSGIGYAVGKLLSLRGHLVYMGCRSEEEVVSLQNKLKEEEISAICIKLDLLTDDILVADTLDIDLLFCQAGYGVSGSVLDLDEKAFQEVYDVNIFRNILFMKKVYQHMKKKHIQGKIFVTSSLIGMFPLPYLAVYSSSKAALSMIVKTLQKEDKEISFCLVEPGAYSTGYNQVMMDAKEKYQKMQNKDYSISFMQKKLFSLLESDHIDKLAFKIVLEMEKKNPRKILRVPWIQGLMLKIYYLFFE